MSSSLVVNCRFLTQKVTGVQRFAIQICKELKKIDSSIEFIAPQNIIDVELANSLGIKRIGINKGVIWEQFDLAIYMSLKSNCYLLNLANTAPILYRKNLITIHDMAVFENPTWFNKHFVRWYKFLLPKISYTAKHIFTVSEFSKECIVRHLNILPGKVSVIPNACDHLAEFRDSDITILKSKFNYLRFILCVGSIESRKNLLFLIDSFLSANIDDNIKLVIVGGREKVFPLLSKDLLNEEAYNKRLLFTGYLTDKELVFLYKKALIFCYPSLYEGFGIPPLEAMSFGCPVLVSEIPSHKEVCGDAALYFNPNNRSELTRALEEILLNFKLRNELVDLGYLQSNKYSWEHSVKLISEFIRTKI